MSVPFIAGKPRRWIYAALFSIMLGVTFKVCQYLLFGPTSHFALSELNLTRYSIWLASALVVLFAWGGTLAYRHDLEKHHQSVESANRAEAERLAQADRVDRQYVLEVIGLGITLDKFRQDRVWAQLKSGDSFASIREQDPNKYPWSEREKDGLAGIRAASTLDSAAENTPAYWGVACFFAASPEPDAIALSTEINPPTVLTDGLNFHLVLGADWNFSERPDRLVESVFAFFDKYPDVPYVFLSAVDGLQDRDLYRPKGSEPLLKDGHYVTSMPDSSAMFVLARRERVDAVRPFAFDDKFDAGLARQLFQHYWELRESFPRGERAPPQRPPLLSEWLAAADKFTKRNDIYPHVLSALIDKVNPWGYNHPDRRYKPTPFFPLPWNKDQLKEFDALPTYGFIHRPVYVKMTDEQGEPVKRSDQRAAALAAGWQEALQTLPEAERQSAITRLVTATDGNSKQTIALHHTINEWTKAGGSEIDMDKPGAWIDTDRRLGNTGAATWFMQMAIGLMGSYRDGGVTAAINMRDPKEASIIMISPPSDEVKKRQSEHGRDVLRHKSSPAIDPANYEQR